MSTRYVVQRFGFRPPRGLVVLLSIVAVFVAAAFWIGPFKARPADLRLLALSGDGHFREYAGIPSKWADTLPPASEATARFPLILAVYNSGARRAQPTTLSLSMPARYRVTNARGQPLPSSASVNNPLVRYELPLRAGAIEPGRQPKMLGASDTLWLEAIVPSMYCTALSDSVPEFVSAPPLNAELLARLRIFYSFEDNSRQRQTGLLTIQVDPDLVRREPAPAPPIFPTEVVRPEAPRPPLDALTYVGSRSTWCGDPGRPVEIFDAVWETAEGGRFIVLYHGGAPRKYLFDLNRDSIVELEMWDQDGDGKFESRRAARMAIPAFLMPFKTMADSLAADSMALDSLGLQLDTTATTPEWMELFYNTGAGPLRFSRQARAPRSDTSAALPRGAAAQPSAPIVIPNNITVDSGFVELFNNSDAGPLRFYRAQHGEKIPPPRPKPAPAPVEPKGPKLLGVPLDSIR